MQNHFKIIHLILAHDYLFYYFEDREELITEHALRWNKRKIVGMAQSLAQRFTRVSMQQCALCMLEQMKTCIHLSYYIYLTGRFNFFFLKKEKELLP